MVVICLGEEPPLNRAERSSHPPASLRNPTAKKGAAVYLVTDLAAECRGDRRDDAARGEITDQCRMPERSVGEDAERGDGGRPHDRQWTSGNCQTFANTR